MPDRAAASKQSVSIVIVLFNSVDFIGACLDSVAELEYPEFEVVLVDNGSSDRSAEVARKKLESLSLDGGVTLLGANRGFAAANNEGSLRAAGDLLFFLNPDAEVYPDTVSALAGALASEERAEVAGCKVYYPDRRTLQHAGGYIRHNGLSMHYGVMEPDEGQWDEPADVTYVTGCAIAVARNTFESLGKFDAGYHPAYFEETDLCLSALRRGGRVIYVPSARVVHHESTTTGRFTRQYYYLYHKNRIRFMLKNFPRSFLVDVALPTEQRWLNMIEAHEQAVPYNKAWAVNILNLPRTIAARRRVAREFGPLPEGITKDL